MTDKCKNCKWWRIFDEGEVEGFCHRFPPIMAGVVFAGTNVECEEKDMEDAFWVVTKEHHFCGEFKEKMEYKPSPGSHA